MNLSITKIYRFEAAHQLVGHEGKCARLHGHSYKLEVTVTGSVIRQGSSEGMVIDFGDLSAVVEREIISQWDHYNLNELVNFRTTAENLTLEAFSRLEKAGLSVSKVTLWETAKAYATVSK